MSKVFQRNLSKLSIERIHFSLHVELGTDIFFPFQTLRCQKKKKTLDIERERKREREEERETRLTEIKRNKRQLMNIRTRQSH